MLSPAEHRTLRAREPCAGREARAMSKNKRMPHNGGEGGRETTETTDGKEDAPSDHN